MRVLNPNGVLSPLKGFLHILFLRCEPLPEKPKDTFVKFAYHLLAK